MTTFRTFRVQTDNLHKTGASASGGTQFVASTSAWKPAILAATVAAGAIFPLQAAHTWTGAQDGNINTKANYSAYTYSGYYNSDNLTGAKATAMYLTQNLTGSFKFAGDSTARYRALCFQKGNDWQLFSNGSSIYTWDNSGGYDSSEDKERICVGSAWKGTATSGDASLRIHALNVKLRRLFVGSTGASAGTLVLDDMDEAGTAYHGPVTLQTTDNMYIQNGSMTCTNATVQCDGDIYIGASGKTATLTQKGGTFTVSTGKWTRFADGSEATINLDGGTFITKRIYCNTATAAINIDGATLKANAVHSDGLIDAKVAVTVKSGGATLDTSALDITVPAAINAAENTAGAFTVTGGGSVTFPNMGDIAGAFTVDDDTALRWFDQDGVVSNYTVSALNLAPGATLYIDADAAGCDTFAVAPNVTATAESPATVRLVVRSMPESGRAFPLFAIAEADTNKVAVAAESPAGASLILERGYADGFITYAIVARDYVWNDGSAGGGWNDGAKWLVDGAAAEWTDNNNAVFAAAGDVATLDSSATAVKLDFRADATVNLAESAEATLAADVVTVTNGVSAAINAPTVNPLTKKGAGALTLGASRSDATVVEEGTLAMSPGATIAPANLTLGVDASKPVTFDYGGQTLDSLLQTFITPGAVVTLTNITVSNTGSIGFNKATFPSVLTVAKDATLDFGDHFTLNTDTEATINVFGGVARATKSANNWFMQTSPRGRLNINVTDGGLFEIGGEAYMLTCRDTVDGSNDYFDPSLYLKLVDSTMRVINGKSLRFGYDDNNKNPQNPTCVFAATNSVIDVAYYINIGHVNPGANTAGSYTADFENCVITARSVRVWQDRPLNAARFNGTRFALAANHDMWLHSAPVFETMGAGGTAIKPITIDAGGLVLDSNGHTGNLEADPQGPGAITKVGSGILRIKRDQTSSSALVCEEGELYVYGGYSVARPITVAAGATFTVNGTAKSSLMSLALAAGAELRIDSYTAGVTPTSIETLTLPESGTVSLTKNNNFAQGKYQILEKAGIAVADVQDKLIPATVDSLPYSWSVEGNTLVLTVGTPTGFSWTGLAGDGKMSTDGNWYGGVAPGAGDPVDFSSLNTATTIAADIDGTFGTVTMGSGVVTFTGALAATSISDTSKVTVGANATVTIEGDLMFEGTGDKYAVYRVEAGGAFIVTGRLGTVEGATGNLYPQSSVGDGIIIAGGIANEGSSYFEVCVNLKSQKWAVGPGGMTGATGWWCFSDAANSAYYYPLTNDFTVSSMTCIRSNFGHYELNTTGWGDGEPHTITLDAGYSDNGALYIAGAGKVVVNHTRAAFGGKNAYSGAVTVNGTATLAINPGKALTSGAITMNAGTTLEVAQSGTVVLGGSLSLADGASLAFNYTDKTVPTLNLTGKTVTFATGSTTNVTVAISADGLARARGGENVLTAGGKFADATVELAPGYPQWVKGIGVNADGDIYIEARPSGTYVIVR